MGFTVISVVKSDSYSLRCRNEAPGQQTGTALIMAGPKEEAAAYVIKAKELSALNFLDGSHPRPSALVWINRATNQNLKPSTISMLMRTLFRPSNSNSVRRLHEHAGLRVLFQDTKDRDKFSRCFLEARLTHQRRLRSHLTAVFSQPDRAENAFKELIAAGVKREAMTLLWRCGQFLQENYPSTQGHSKTSVSVATFGGGVAGAILGVSLFSIPGIGPVALSGALAAQAFGTISAVGSALGATGGAIARMLTDIDVDGRDIGYFELKVQQGSVFVSIDPAMVDGDFSRLRDILAGNGAQFAAE